MITGANPSNHSTMKNKHLLLIFLATLCFGLIAKYAPWFKSDNFQADLVRVDTTNLVRISIQQPGQPELLLERSDEGWVASQDDYAVRTADSNLAPILTALSAIRSIRIVHSERRDTLLLLPTQAIHVEVSMNNGRRETFEIGKELLENQQPATFIEIDRHEGIYLTDKHLRRIFTRSVDDFRCKTLLAFSPENLRSLAVFRPGIDTLLFQKSDTSAVWNTGRVGESIPVEQVKAWLKSLEQLNHLPFAAHADERLDMENLAAVISLGMSTEAEPLLLHIFNTGAQNHPVSTTKQSLKRQSLPAFVLQSSQNPLNFFALSDTLLAKKICTGLRPMSSVLPLR